MRSSSQKNMYMIGLTLGNLFYGGLLMMLAYVYWPLSPFQIVGLGVGSVIGVLLAKRNWAIWKQSRLDQAPEILEPTKLNIIDFCVFLLVLLSFELLSQELFTMFAIMFVMLLWHKAILRNSGEVSR